MDQMELRYQAVQCHVRSSRAAHVEDAEWLREVAVKLSLMADVEDDRLTYHACRELSRSHAPSARQSLSPSDGTGHRPR